MAANDECCMDVLKVVIVAVFLLSSSFVFADVKTKCQSSQEFISTVDYLRKQKKFSIPDSEVFKAALSVSKNCSGASAKFQKMLNNLTAAGVDHDHAIRFSILYSKQEQEAVDAFLELFQGLVLEKKFNLPFYQAFETAKFFAESSQINKTTLKKDFLGFLEFCFEDNQGALLSLDHCRKLSLEYLKLHDKYPNGVFKDFKDLFSFLRDEKETGLPISKALSLTQQVLLNGPGSKKNFIDAYKYGLFKLNLKPSKSLELALRLASYTQVSND